MGTSTGWHGGWVPVLVEAGTFGAPGGGVGVEDDRTELGWEIIGGGGGMGERLMRCGRNGVLLSVMWSLSSVDMG